MGGLGWQEWVIIWGIIGVYGAIVVYPFIKIFSKAGFSGWLGVAMLLPVVNLFMLYYLAFAEWPGVRNVTESTKQ